MQLCLEKESMEKELAIFQIELQEHVEVMNENLSKREDMQSIVVKTIDNMENKKGNLVQVELQLTALGVEQQVSEHFMKEIVSTISAQEIASTLNTSSPNRSTLMVFKTACLINGIFPRSNGALGSSTKQYSDAEWWRASQALMMDRNFLQRQVCNEKSILTA